MNMGITKIALKFAAPVPKIESYSRYLFIGPHPDDIDVGAGATAAKLAAEGKEICYLVCTDGRFGEEFTSLGITADELCAMRREEQIRSAAAVGVRDVRFLGLSDGGLYDYNELVKGIAEVVSDFKPELILCPDPRVKSECHPDHLNTGNAASTIAFFAPFEKIMKAYGGTGSAPVDAIAYFMTAEPNRFVGTDGFLKLQLEALFSNHVSQFPEGNYERKYLELYIKLRAYDFGIRSFHKTAEGFRVLGRTHMHCLTEA